MSKIFRNLRFDWPLHLVMLLCSILPDNVVFIRLRGYLCSFFIKSCGRRFGVGRNVTFYNPANISVGSDVYIAQGSWISAGHGVSIEDEALIAPYVVIATANHTKIRESYRFGQPIGGEIIVGRGSWIGPHCTIGAGVVIGQGSVIGANSFVNKSVPDSVLCAGVPAKVIKEV